MRVPDVRIELLQLHFLLAEKKFRVQVVHFQTCLLIDRFQVFGMKSDRVPLNEEIAKLAVKVFQAEMRVIEHARATVAGLAGIVVAECAVDNLRFADDKRRIVFGRVGRPGHRGGSQFVDTGDETVDIQVARFGNNYQMHIRLEDVDLVEK
jgi:hypothetical protein